MEYQEAERSTISLRVYLLLLAWKSPCPQTPPSILCPFPSLSPSKTIWGKGSNAR